MLKDIENQKTERSSGDEYIFSGGAHGTTTRISQNWNIQTGNQITLNHSE